MRYCPAPRDIIAALRADAPPAPAPGGRLAYRCMPAGLGLALSGLRVAGLLVSVLVVSVLIVSGLGSTAAGRSTYFGASAACGTSAVRGPSVVLAGALTFVVSPPPSDKLRSPACAAADTKTNPAIRMNLRMVVSPREVWPETMRGGRFVM